MTAAEDLSKLDKQPVAVLGTTAENIQIVVWDNECVHYQISGYNAHKNEVAPHPDGLGIDPTMSIVFADRRPGSPEEQLTGITDDVLLAILEHRLRAYDNSLAKCVNNTEALLHIQLTRGLLKMRGHKNKVTAQ